METVARRGHGGSIWLSSGGGHWDPVEPGARVHGWTHAELLEQLAGGNFCVVESPKPASAPRGEQRPARSMTDAMIEHLRSRGLEPRREVAVERRPGEGDLEFAVRRRFAQP